MIKSLQDNFVASRTARDENGQGYYTMLKGEIPQASQNTETHIASRLLTLRFLDIVQSLEKEVPVEIDGVDVVRKNISILKFNVCFQVRFILEL